MQLPAGLQDSDSKVADDAKGGLQDADKAYQDGAELLTHVSEGSAPQELKQAARTQDIYTQYGWYLLASSIGAKEADDHLKEAQAQRDAVMQSGGTILNLPAELIPPPAAPTTAPAPGAATPAAQPPAQ